MNYQVSRNGQLYGPYTLDDLRRYVDSGNVLLTDLACAEGSTDWIPVAQVLGVAHQPAAAGSLPYGATPFAAGPAYAGAVAPAYVDPPNLNWVLVLLFGILTCGLFIFIWDLVQAAWMKRVLPSSRALIFYIAAFVCEFINGFATVSQASAFRSGHYAPHINFTGGVFGLIYFVLLITARFSMRGSLEEFYNRVDPIGLRLGPVMTFFFGSIYFQYHFNRIHDLKRALLYRGQPM